MASQVDQDSAQSQPGYDGERAASAGAEPSAASNVRFSETGDFAAYRAAEAWLQARGYSIGHMQRGEPCGLLRGDYDIQKWRNLSNQDRRDLDGTLSGNFRQGPVVIRLTKALSPPAARPESGTTGAPDEPETCLACEGSGQIPHPDDPVSYDCEDCSGTGFLTAKQEG